MRDRVQDKVVLITGASAGIGAALARELGKRGSRLALLARRLDRLDALAAELRAAGVKVAVAAADVAQDGELERAVEKTHAELGPIDIAVANAGFSVNGPLAKLSLDDHRRQLETNLFGVLRTYIATRDDLKAQRGRLAVIGSVSGYVATPGVGAYNISKFAVRAFCDTLRDEVFEDGVSVTHIIPGFIETEIRHLDKNGVYSEQNKDPVPRWLQMSAAQAASEIADAIELRQGERILTRHGQLGVMVGRHVPGVLSAANRLMRLTWRSDGLSRQRRR